MKIDENLDCAEPDALNAGSPEKCRKEDCPRPIYYKKGQLCISHRNEELVIPSIKRLIAEFTTPFDFNLRLFQICSPLIKLEEACDNRYEWLSSLCRFLSLYEIREPLTWEFIFGLDLQALEFRRSTAESILKGLKWVGGILSIRDEPLIEPLSNYYSRRAALAPLKGVPPFLRPTAEAYAENLWAQNHSDRDVGHHLETVKRIGRWCQNKEIRALSEVQPSMLRFFLREVRYAWACLGCGQQTDFDNTPMYSGSPCPGCEGTEFKKARRCCEEHVRMIIYRLRAFFEWCRERRIILVNPAANLETKGAPEPIRRYLEKEEDKKIQTYMTGPEATPREVILWYLFRHHALKVTEIRSSLVPPEMGGDGKSLKDCYALIIPGKNADEPERRIEFLEEAAWYLKPALEAYELERNGVLMGRPSLYFFPARAGHSGKVGLHYFDELLRKASRKIFDSGRPFTPSMLRATWRDTMLTVGGPAALVTGSHAKGPYPYRYSFAQRQAISRSQPEKETPELKH